MFNKKEFLKELKDDPVFRMDFINIIGEDLTNNIKIQDNSSQYNSVNFGSASSRFDDSLYFESYTFFQFKLDYPHFISDLINESFSLFLKKIPKNKTKSLRKCSNLMHKMIKLEIDKKIKSTNFINETELTTITQSINISKETIDFFICNVKSILEKNDFNLLESLLYMEKLISS